MAFQLLINEPPLQVLPSLARTIGLNEAIVLQQVHYWLNPQFNKNFFEGRHWVHNTFTQWHQQFSFWSKKTIKRTIASLEASGFLVSFRARDFKKTKYYTLNYELLMRMSLLDSHTLPLADTSSLANKAGGCSHPLEQQGSPLWGQNDPVRRDNLSSSTEPKCPSRERQSDPIDSSTERVQYGLQPSERQGSSPWGQNDPAEKDNLSPSTGPKCLPREGQSDSIDSSTERAQYGLQPSEQQGLCSRGGQYDPVGGDNLSSSTGPKCPPREGQIDPIDGVNLSPSHYIENTIQENTLENILPPPSSSSARAKEEEEEEKEKIIYFPSNPQLAPVHPSQQMLDLWNRMVQSKLHLGGRDVHLTLKRRKLLEEFLDSVLKGKLEAWKDYCALIASSRFLTGHNPSGFKVTLDWAIVPDNAYKVLEGAIYDKPEIVKKQPNTLSWQAFSEELVKTLPSNLYLLPWIKISVSLAKIMGQEKYKNCFAKVSLKELTQTKAIFSVESKVIKDSLIRNHSSELRCAVESVYPTVKQIEFEVCSSEDDNAHSPTTGEPK